MTHLDPDLGQERRLVQAEVAHPLHGISDETDAEFGQVLRRSRRIAPPLDLGEGACVLEMAGDDVKRPPRAQEHVGQVLNAVHAVVPGRVDPLRLPVDLEQLLRVEDQDRQACRQQGRQRDVAGRVGEQDDDNQVFAAGFEAGDRGLDLLPVVAYTGELDLGERRQGIREPAPELGHVQLELGPGVVQVEHQAQQTHARFSDLVHSRRTPLSDDALNPAR